jgi:hypothetical protein
MYTSAIARRSVFRFSVKSCVGNSKTATISMDYHINILMKTSLAGTAITAAINQLRAWLLGHNPDSRSTKIIALNIPIKTMLRRYTYQWSFWNCSSVPQAGPPANSRHFQFSTKVTSFHCCNEFQYQDPLWITIRIWGNFQAQRSESQLI